MGFLTWLFTRHRKNITSTNPTGCPLDAAASHLHLKHPLEVFQKWSIIRQLYSNSSIYNTEDYGMTPAMWISSPLRSRLKYLNMYDGFWWKWFCKDIHGSQRMDPDNCNIFWLFLQRLKFTFMFLEWNELLWHTCCHQDELWSLCYNCLDFHQASLSGKNVNNCLVYGLSCTLCLMPISKC